MNRSTLPFVTQIASNRVVDLRQENAYETFRLTVTAKACPEGALRRRALIVSGLPAMAPGAWSGWRTLVRARADENRPLVL
jgi:hypothetical protein